DEELLEAETLHDFELIPRHRALRVRLVIRARFRLAAAAVAAQVGANNREVLRESRGDLRPHRVGLGESVQQEQGWAGAALAQADRHFVGLYVLQRKSIEHDPLVN